MSRVQKGVNDLKTWCKQNDREDLLLEWDYEKNGALRPEDVSRGSERKVWWKGQCGHSWEMMVGNRTRIRCGCNICSSTKLYPGVNDLQTLNPELASEWHSEKNKNLTPKDVFFHSGKKVWWRCAKGHEWQSTVNHRSQGKGCPYCVAEKHTSFPEQVVFYYVSKCFTNISSRQVVDSYEIDIYLNDYKTGIEYDGQFFHNSKQSFEREKRKNEYCKREGIRLIRIKESDENKIVDDVIYYIYDPSYKCLAWVINSLLKELLHIDIDIDFTIDIERDRTDIYEQYICSKKTNSLLEQYPDIAAEWNYEKNGLLNPSMLSRSSGKKVWWKCPKGHEYQMFVYSRIAGSGCPYCAGKRTIIGETDLLTTHPNIAAEWNYEKNGSLTPKDVSAGSGQKVWWKCSEGHEWMTSVSNRVSGRSCSACRRIKNQLNVIPIDKSLSTTHPDIAKEWNYEKNGLLTPDLFSAGSNKKVWWKCSKDHEWETVISNRTKGCGCPFCAGCAHKVVLCVETGIVYSSLSDAAKACGLTDGYPISLCCRGKRKTSGGYHWKYVEQ